MDDFAQYHSGRDDFYAVPLGAEVKVDVIDARFRDAYASLKDLGLFRVEENRSTGQITIWIAKQ